MRRIAAVLVACLVAIVGASTPSAAVVGQTLTWVGASGDWNTATNWDGNQVPTSLDTAVIDTTVTVTASGSPISFKKIELGNAAGTSAPTLALGTTIAAGGDVVVSRGATLESLLLAPLTFDNLTVGNGGRLTHQANGSSNTELYELNLMLSGALMLQSGSVVDVSGKGHGGATGPYQHGYGPGGGLGSSDAGGGGHGGAGGNCRYNAPACSGGPAYGSATNPVNLGSGGGGGYNNGQYGSPVCATAGGGAIVVLAQSADLSGTITANGKNKTSPCAGATGSGGTVNIQAQVVTGSGTLTADGGNSSTDNNQGGGGGGRILVAAYVSNGFTGSCTAAGGTVPAGANPGDLGTSNCTVTYNQPPVADPNGPYLGAMDAAITFDGTASSDPDGVTLTYDWAWGDTSSSPDAGATPTHPYAAAGIYDVCLMVTDPAGESDTACTSVVVYDPSGTFVTGGGWIDSPVGAYYPAEPFLDGSYYEMVALEEPVDWFDARDAAAAMIRGGCTGAHLATVTSQAEYEAVLEVFGEYQSGWLGGYQDEGVSPADAGWQWVTGEPFTFEAWLSGEPNDSPFGVYGPAAEQQLEMYPSGWNDVPGDSPRNTFVVEYDGCQQPTGKATFGFVSKYKKGAATPTGNTEFVFKAADLGFHASSYDWLVVTGNDYAHYKGMGTINGSGEYKFMLWAGDNDPDTFRIRIWTEDDASGVETVVYDNGMDQPIGGGSIVVHAKGK